MHLILGCNCNILPFWPLIGVTRRPVQATGIRHFSDTDMSFIPVYSTQRPEQIEPNVMVHYSETCLVYVRFEVFTAMTMKNVVYWDVTPCGSCKNRHFGGT
jgi:hypothetical protein